MKKMCALFLAGAWIAGASAADLQLNKFELTGFPTAGPLLVDTVDFLGDTAEIGAVGTELYATGSATGPVGTEYRFNVNAAVNEDTSVAYDIAFEIMIPGDYLLSSVYEIEVGEGSSSIRVRNLDTGDVLFNDIYTEEDGQFGGANFTTFLPAGMYGVDGGFQADPGATNASSIEFAVIQIPEPASVITLGLAALAALRRRLNG